jgi:glycosyltransferase involved in cell wall biosynthesis
MENTTTNEPLELSVVVPISERHDDLKKLYRLYAEQLKQMDKSFEFIFIIDGHFPEAKNTLLQLKVEHQYIHVIELSKSFGESAALNEGFRHAKGKLILTIAAYLQVEPAELPKLFEGYSEGYEMVVTRRHPRKDPLVNRLQSAIYHFLVRKMTGTSFHDITSGMRLFGRNILSEMVLYGDLHRFIPIFAVQRGIRVLEINVSQRKEDTKVRLVRPGIYVRRFLDILTIFFLYKFTQKPLRFFGLIGLTLAIPGALITLYLGLMRLLEMVSLQNHPFLLVGILLMVFGIQILSIGLIGELIIFSRTVKGTQYRIRTILE